MAKAEIEETLSVDRDKFFQAVVGYEQYPKFVEGCTKVEVDRSKPPVSRVTYHVSMIKDISYTLDHTEDLAAGKVTWKLVKSDFLKKNVGEWTIQSVGPGKTKVKYSIEIEFNIPVPGLILNRLVKSSLPSMIKAFEKKRAPERTDLTAVESLDRAATSFSTFQKKLSLGFQGVFSSSKLADSWHPAC